MPVSLHLRGPGLRSEPVLHAVREVFAELTWVEHTFSPYRSDSVLSRLRTGRTALADCGPLVREVFELCDLASQATDGWFCAHRPDPQGRPLLDPTGLVKGWALQRAGDQLDRLSGHAYCLNGGGDVLVGGTVRGESGRSWRVGVEDPTDRTRVAGVIELCQGAVATSGTAARGRHLIDPRTGRPVHRTGSVTVRAPSLLWADVWATALFVGPDDLQQRLPGGPDWQVLRLPDRLPPPSGAGTG